MWPKYLFNKFILYKKKNYHSDPNTFMEIYFARLFFKTKNADITLAILWNVEIIFIKK